MKTWSVIFNLFAVLILTMLLVVYYNEAAVTQKEFEEERLRLAVNYSAEASFLSTISVENIGIEYKDMGAVIINPGDSLDIFESMMCLNYDMSASEENKADIESYIPTMVLVCNDGYYIAERPRRDTTLNRDAISKMNALTWSVKKPFTIKNGNKLYAVNIHNEDWVAVRDNAGTLEKSSGTTYPSGINKDNILRAVNSEITQDMLYQINWSNVNRVGWDYTFYLPPIQTSAGVNPITRPSLLVLVQGADFASTHKLDTVDVAGLKTVRNKVIIAFKDPTSGIKYYCYEGQLPDSLASYVENYYESAEDAAKNGYEPNFDYLQKKISGE